MNTLFQRAIIVLATLLLLSACSIKTVYNNLDWALEAMVDDYLSLSDMQEQDVEQRIAQILKWHRETQLDLYVKDLKMVKASTNRGLDDESAEAIFAAFMQRWESIKKQFAPNQADVLLTLNQQQIDDLFEKLEEENRELTEEINETSAEEKLEKSREKLIRNFSDWLGPLNEEQKQILRSWPPRFKPLDQDRMAFRKKWQAELRAIFESGQSREEKRARLIELAESPDKFQTEEHKNRLVYNSKQVKELILTFDPTVTQEQKAYLAERLDYYIVSFEELAAEAKQASAEENSDVDL
jgi:hypothetical protein